VDPQVARVTLNLLAKGQAVGVFPEGERSWDGELKDLRIGTVKLLLKAGVPVIPCGIIGAYEVAPRWGKFNWKSIGIRRETIVIRYGEPLVFGSHDSRMAREKALPLAMEKVRRALERVVQ
jgi:1-acyl-sn-glycerol-3-phosphate acyltransferase